MLCCLKVVTHVRECVGGRVQRAHVGMCVMCVWVYVCARADVQALQMGRVSRCVGVGCVWGYIGDQAGPGPGA